MRRVIGLFVWLAVWALYAGTWLAARAGGALVSRRTLRPGERRTLIVTGRFFSANWAKSHLLPLARAGAIEHLIAVVDGPIEGLDPRVEVRPSPRWIAAMFGRNAARFIGLLSAAMRARPAAIMGYHLFPAGMAALVAARMCGARAIYQSTGGVLEVLGGGAGCENAVLSRLNGPSAALERWVKSLCRQFDCIIARGQSAKRYFLDECGARDVAVIGGSIDTACLAQGDAERDIDIVFVGRLTDIKQPEQVVEIVAKLQMQNEECRMQNGSLVTSSSPAPTNPGRIRATFVGDGPMLHSLQQLARSRGVDSLVHFAGHVERGEEYLSRSRVFLLTSRSEGLSIAMAEAMAAGCVPIVANVGDLGEIVENDVTGWLVTPNSIAEYATRVAGVLSDSNAWSRLSSAARERARSNNGLEAVTARWDELFTRLCPKPATQHEAEVSKAPVTKSRTEALQS
ncbi:MAG: glycosyltransferase [Phycisphaerae bacterium]|nr:glycosyltransferase [Phycisphaerae bacterium]